MTKSTRRCMGFAICAVALFWLMVGALPQAVAQQSPGVAQSPSASGRYVTQPATVANGFYTWLSRKQGEYNQKLSQTIREIRTEPFAATILLAVLSFAYGVLHAAGPGHGKAVISSYVLANERTMRRGIALSFLAAAFQALSAILLVGVLVLVFKASGLTRKATEAWLETVSWGIVTLLGAWLLWGQVRRLMAARGQTAAGSQDHDHHGHAHGHDHTHGDDCAECGHVHMPDPRQLEGNWSWSKAVALAAAVGIRPCTGAVFVLGFAMSQGLLWAGIFATFAMAIGTAITVSALAAIAVGSREWAARIGGGSDSVWSRRVQTAAGLVGSLAVMLFGLTLFLGSLGPGSAF